MCAVCSFLIILVDLKLLLHPPQLSLTHLFNMPRIYKAPLLSKSIKAPQIHFSRFSILYVYACDEQHLLLLC